MSKSPRYHLSVKIQESRRPISNNQRQTYDTPLVSVKAASFNRIIMASSDNRLFLVESHMNDISADTSFFRLSILTHFLKNNLVFLIHQ